MSLVEPVQRTTAPDASRVARPVRWSQRVSPSRSVRISLSKRAVLPAKCAATDSCHGWDDYRLLVGARFDGHPWTQEVTLEVLEPKHPATNHLDPAGWRWHDEVYQFRDLRPDARVLLRVRDGELDASAPGAKQPEFGFPLSWCFTEGAGRVFSTTLGHFPGAWESPVYLRHVAGGLAWALGEGT